MSTMMKEENEEATSQGIFNPANSRLPSLLLISHLYILPFQSKNFLYDSSFDFNDSGVIIK